MIKEHVSDENVLQLTYLLAVQLTLGLGGQLTLKQFEFKKFFDNQLTIES